MNFNNKVVYRAVGLLVFGLAVTGALLGAFGLIRASLSLLGLTIAALPVLGHLRMREGLAAVRRIPQTPGSTFDFQPVLEQLSAMDHRLTVIAEEQPPAKSTPHEFQLTDELRESVAQIRRESRMARIAAAQITGNL